MTTITASRKRTKSGRPNSARRAMACDERAQRFEEALDALKAVVTSANAPPAARVSAATAILDRGWGRPKETVDVTHRKTIEDWVRESYRPREDEAATAANDGDKLQ